MPAVFTVPCRVTPIRWALLNLMLFSYSFMNIVNSGLLFFTYIGRKSAYLDTGLGSDLSSQSRPSYSIADWDAWGLSASTEWWLCFLSRSPFVHRLLSTWDHAASNKYAEGLVKCKHIPCTRRCKPPLGSLWGELKRWSALDEEPVSTLLLYGVFVNLWRPCARRSTLNSPWVRCLSLCVNEHQLFSHIYLCDLVVAHLYHSPWREEKALRDIICILTPNSCIDSSAKECWLEEAMTKSNGRPFTGMYPLLILPISPGISSSSAPQVCLGFSQD